MQLVLSPSKVESKTISVKIRVNDTGNSFAHLLMWHRFECNRLSILRVEIQTILNAASLAATTSLSSMIVVVAHLMMLSTTTASATTSLVHHIHLLLRLMIVGIAWMMIIMVLILS